jgi:hypothetical protein
MSVCVPTQMSASSRRLSVRRIVGRATGLVVLSGALAAGVSPGSAAVAPTAITTIPVHSGTTSVAVNASTDTIYVVSGKASDAPSGLALTGALTAINGHSDHVTGTIGLPDPVGVAVDPVTDMVYVVSTEAPETAVGTAEPVAGMLWAINGRSNKVVAKVNIAGAVAVGVDSLTDTIFVPGGGYSTFVVDGRTNKLKATVPNIPYPNGVAVDPKTDTAFVSAGDPDVGGVWAINGQTDQPPGQTTGSTPATVTAIGISAVGVDTNSGTVYVTVEGPFGEEVSFFHSGAKKAAKSLVLSGYAIGLANVAADSATGTGYVVANAEACGEAIYALNGATHKVSGILNFTLPKATAGVQGIAAVDPATDLIYVTAGSAVDVIHGGFSGGTVKTTCGGGGSTLGA